MPDVGRWVADAAIVAALSLGYVLPSDAQLPLTKGQIDTLLMQEPAVPDTQILGMAARSCLAFVPTPQAINGFRALRPGLSAGFEDKVAAVCISGQPKAGGTRTLSVSTADLLWLIERKHDEVIAENVDVCPRDQTPPRVIREVAKGKASPRVLDHVAAVCGIALPGKQVQFSAHVGYAPLWAASEIRSQNLDFLGGTALTFVVAWPLDRGVQVIGELGFGWYELDQPGIDLSASGSFRLISPGVAVRFLPTCLVRQSRCGDYLLSDDDVSIDVVLSANILEGDSRFSAQGTNSSASFTFSGTGIGVRLGYVRRFSRHVAIEVTGGYGLIGFRQVTIDAPNAHFEDNTGGVSTRGSLAASFVLSP